MVKEDFSGRCTKKTLAGQERKDVPYGENLKGSVTWHKPFSNAGFKTLLWEKKGERRSHRKSGSYT